MAYLHWNLLRDALSHAGILKYARATGGSTTTAIATTHPTGEKNSDWKNGTLIVLRDSAGAAAAPEGQFSRITDYAPSTFTWTIADTLTAAIASGDRLGLAREIFHHDELIELANDALRQFGLIGYTDTSLTTATDQREYDLPVGIKLERPVAVYIQGKTGDSNNNQWVTKYDWDIGFTAAGSVGLLLTESGWTADRTIKLEYLALHPVINAYSDVISEYVHPVLARASLVERMANRITQGAQNAVPEFRFTYDKAIKEFEDAKEKYPIYKPIRSAKLLIIK